MGIVLIQSPAFVCCVVLCYDVVQTTTKRNMTEILDYVDELKRNMTQVQDSLQGVESIANPLINTAKQRMLALPPACIVSCLVVL